MPLDYIYATRGDDGRVIYALTPDSYQKVREGFACGECLEDWSDRYGTALLSCPNEWCKAPTGPAAIVPEPAEWVSL